MNTYKIVIAENIGHRQFVGFIEAESEKEAREKAKSQFIIEHPIYDAHFKIIMCHKMQNY